MFYLLEDNRIIDSEKLPKDVKIERIAKDDKGNAFFIQIQYSDFLKTRKIGYIKKQSENVFALIENGDLIKTNYGSLRNVRRLQIDGVVIDHECCIFFENIIAIYKPDEKGNYIKVWEKKEDE